MIRRPHCATKTDTPSGALILVSHLLSDLLTGRSPEYQSGRISQRVYGGGDVHAPYIHHVPHPSLYEHPARVGPGRAREKVEQNGVGHRRGVRPRESSLRRRSPSYRRRTVRPGHRPRKHIAIGPAIRIDELGLLGCIIPPRATVAATPRTDRPRSAPTPRGTPSRHSTPSPPTYATTSPGGTA